MKSRHIQSKRKATIGSIVTLRILYNRDISNPHGIPVIVCVLSTNLELGQGIQAVNVNGIICSGKRRRE